MKPDRSIPSKLPDYIYEKYIPSLDGLRAFSIILVIMSHVALGFHNSFITELHLGSFGVSIFFVISGFLITSLLLKEKHQQGRISLKNFYTRRILRIIPVAYLYLLTLLILKYFSSHNFDSGNILRAAFFCENFVGHPMYTASSHYWSLSVEEQFYLFVPFILVKGIKLFFKVSFFLFICTPLFIYAYYHFTTGSIFLNDVLFILNGIFGTGMITILTGCITAIMVFYFPHKLNFKFKNAVFIQILLLTAGWYFHGMLYLPTGINQVIGSVFIAVLILSVISNRDNIVFKILNFKFVKYIGMISYSLYIWQEIFCYQQPWANSSMPGTSVVLNMVLLLITAMLSYHLYERQFLKLKNKFHSKLNLFQIRRKASIVS